MAEKVEVKVKRLYRSKKERIFGGVCGGIAKYFNADPTLIRIVWIVLTLISRWWVGIIFYIICYLIIPEEPEEEEKK